VKNFTDILQRLPYSSPYRFVDEITFLSDTRAEGNYRFKPDEFFYEGHFTGRPVTPGLILVECMGQIGLVAMALYLFPGNDFVPLLSTVEAEFLVPVLPGEKVFIESDKVFYRNGILKCNIRMFNESRTEVARTLAILKMQQND